MIVEIVYFVFSFLADIFAYIFYQKFTDSRKTDVNYLILSLLCAFAVWFFIFRLQDRGQMLRTFIPFWAAGAAVVGYFVSGIFTHTPISKLFSLSAIISITAIGLGIFFLSRQSQ